MLFAKCLDRLVSGVLWKLTVPVCQIPLLSPLHGHLTRNRQTREGGLANSKLIIEARRAGPGEGAQSISKTKRVDRNARVERMRDTYVTLPLAFNHAMLTVMSLMQ